MDHTEICFFVFPGFTGLLIGHNLRITATIPWGGGQGRFCDVIRSKRLWKDPWGKYNYYDVWGIH